MAVTARDDVEHRSPNDRRTFLRGVGLAGAAGLTGTAGCIGGGGGGSATINVLTWEEFADPDLKDPIEDELDVTLEITKSTSSSKMFSNWNAGQDEQYDIAVPNNNYVPKMMDADLVAPVDRDVVSNWDGLYGKFQEFADNQFASGGEHYGVPIRFGWYGYGYDTREVPDHDPSYAIMFEEDYVDVNLDGEIIMYDNHFKTMAATALYLGHRDAFEGSEVTLSSSQIDEVKETLLDQKSRLQGYISADPTYIKQFRQGNFLVGHSGRNEHVEMWLDGDDWPEFAAPKEGALAWFESAVVSKQSENKDKAWEVINQWISTDIGSKLAKVGYSPSCNPSTSENLTSDENDLFGKIDPSRLEGMIPFKAVANEEDWKSAWEEVKTA